MWYAAAGDPGDQVCYRQVRDLRDNLVDFAVIQMAKYHGELIRVAVADICHLVLHIHLYDQRGNKIAREPVRPCTSRKDVDDCYDAALDRIEQQWERYKRRWSRGRA